MTKSARREKRERVPWSPDAYGKQGRRGGGRSLGRPLLSTPQPLPPCGLLLRDRHLEKQTWPRRKALPGPTSPTWSSAGATGGPRPGAPLRAPGSVLFVSAELPPGAGSQAMVRTGQRLHTCASLPHPGGARASHALAAPGPEGTLLSVLSPRGEQRSGNYLGKWLFCVRCREIIRCLSCYASHGIM